VHPNTGSRRSKGANRVQLEELERLGEALPANIRMVAADIELSSYTLMDLATVGLAWHSTVALELACKGRHTVVAAGNMVSGVPFVHTVERADRYEEQLDALVALSPGTADPQVRRLAWRFAYGRFFRTIVDFPLVRMTDPVGAGEVRWHGDDDLLPGVDAGVDRCARILLEGEPVCPPPTERERARTDADEVAVLESAPPRAFAALAFAEELIADPALLEAWGETFSAFDDATLVIHAPQDEIPPLIAAIARAGLEGEDAPDLMAIDGDPAALAVDALFTRDPREGLLPHLPRHDESSTAALRMLADLCGVV
jgi:hypothetical protein